MSDLIWCFIIGSNSEHLIWRIDYHMGNLTTNIIRNEYTIVTKHRYWTTFSNGFKISLNDDRQIIDIFKRSLFPGMHAADNKMTYQSSTIPLMNTMYISDIGASK